MTMHPRIAIPDVDRLAARVGLKPGNRITLPPERVPAMEASVAAEGFAVARAERPVQFPGQPPQAVLYFARSREYAEELARAEAPILPGGPPRPPTDELVGAHVRFGELLGFPSCCVAAFVARLRRGVHRRADGTRAHEDFVAAEEAAARTGELLGRLNDLLPDRTLRLISFYPCRYDCPVAGGYAERLAAEVERVSAGAAAAIRAALVGRVSIATDGKRAVEPGAGEVLALEFARF